MMLFYPLLRKWFTSLKIYFIAMVMCIIGYASLLIIASTAMSNVFILFIPAFFIFGANGILSVLTTVFLANTVDYGELKNRRRDESVIFSMQTFVVKLASGLSALVASLAIQIFNFSSDSAVTEEMKTVDFSEGIELSQKMGIRMTMTLIPIAGLIFAMIWFRKRYKLTDEKIEEIAAEVKKQRALDSKA